MVGSGQGRWRGLRGACATGALLIAGIVLFTGDTASAQVGESDFATSGVYVGVAGGVAVENARGTVVDDSWAVGGWIGYRALPLLAIEAQVEHSTEDNLSGESGGLESVTWTANTRLYLSNGRFQPYLLIGVGMSFAMEGSNSKIGDDAGFALRAGGGLETHITGGLSLILAGSYVTGSGANRHLNYTSATAGVQYQF